MPRRRGGRWLGGPSGAPRGNRGRRAEPIQGDPAGGNRHDRRHDTMATHKLPALAPMPAMPHRGGRAVAPRVCTCGCGGMTRGGRYIPGHDARHRGWAIRIARGYDTTGITPGERRAAEAALRAGHWQDLRMPAPARAPRASKEEVAEAMAAFTPPADEAAG